MSYQEVERAAIAFVLEDAMWPAFLAWLRGRPPTPQALAAAVFATGRGLDGMRDEWVLHSPDARIRALGGA